MNNTHLELVFPAVDGREVHARCGGGDITSNAGSLLVRQADRRLGLSQAMAGCVTDSREQSKMEHSFVGMMRERIFSISQGYEDANDLDRLGADPALKVACERLHQVERTL